MVADQCVASGDRNRTNWGMTSSDWLSLCGDLPYIATPGLQLVDPASTAAIADESLNAVGNDPRRGTASMGEPSCTRICPSPGLNPTLASMARTVSS